MAVINVGSDLDVTQKFRALVSEALSGESAYIRAKETLEHLVKEDLDMASADKAKLIAEVIGGIATNINNTAMGTALQWAAKEKDVELSKLELAKQLDILDQDKLLKVEQTDQVTTAIRNSTIENKRIYGTATWVDGAISVLADDGKVFNETQLAIAQKAKIDEETNLTAQKIKESYAAVHKIVADTYANFGNYTYANLTAAGVETVTKKSTGHVSLSDTQKTIAQEQAKGYTYNAWANALTGSASMLGTAIAAEYAEFGENQTGGQLLSTVLTTANNLKDTTAPTFT